jgi:LysM repeat protein
MKVLRNLILAAVIVANLALIGGTGAQDLTTKPAVVHVVQRGENLFRIALRYGVSVAQVKLWNNITNANLIYAGQSLYIYNGQTNPPPPAGKNYIVQRGDTLGRIARTYGVDMWVLARVNNIVNLNYIYVGQSLTIPDFTTQ